jgi:hypothetical protein
MSVNAILQQRSLRATTNPIAFIDLHSRDAYHGTTQ